MTEKYIARGGTLTAYERELLGILQEECAEVIVAVSKLLRFGPRDCNPTTRVPNHVDLALEMGDLSYMLAKVGQLPFINRDDVAKGSDRKHERLRKYMQSTPS